MRNCCVCRAEDKPELLEHEKCTCRSIDDGLAKVLGHEPDCRRIWHYVQREIRFHSGVLTKKLQSQGFSEGKVFMGKQAIQRFICAACINRAADAAELVAYVKKDAKSREQDPQETMYQILSY